MEIKITVTKHRYIIFLKDSEIEMSKREIFQKLFPSLEVTYRNNDNNDLALIFTAKYNIHLIIEKELEDWFTLDANQIKDRIESIYIKVNEWYFDTPTSYTVFDLPIIE